MSQMSATGVLTPAHAEAYTSALLGLLGTQNPLVVLRETPDALRSALERLTPAQIRHPEAPGKWSTLQVVQHLADAELVNGFRLRMILAHDRPAIPSYDQDLWATWLRYDEVSVEESLEQFSTLRRANLRLWGGASPTELTRAGVHAERGEESIERMRRLCAGHDLAHRHQMARIRILFTGQ